MQTKREEMIDKIQKSVENWNSKHAASLGKISIEITDTTVNLSNGQIIKLPN